LGFAISLFFVAVLGGSAAHAQSGPSWKPSQSDLDNLAQRFRPYIKFSTGVRQESRPVTWQYLYANAKLVKGNAVLVPLGGLRGAGASQVLTFADIRGNPAEAKEYSLDVDESHDAEYGEPWQQAEQGDGLYAHVTYLADVTGQSPSANLVNIEYYLLFGLNVGPSQGVNDHQGDLIGVQVVYDHASDKLVRVTYSQHGKSLIMFDLAHSPAPTVATLKGKNDRGVTIEQPACKVNAQSHGFYAGGTYMTEGGEHHLFFMRDPVSQQCEHLAMYLEHGSHEPWPNQTGFFLAAASHNGDDVSYLPTTVHVLAPGIDDPFVFFGGNLGKHDGPNAVSRHKMWLGYNRNADPADRDPYVDEGDLKWLPTLLPTE
jgi:hypothetical protein